jgi:hypothetical protein
MLIEGTGAEVEIEIVGTSGTLIEGMDGEEQVISGIEGGGPPFT